MPFELPPDRSNYFRLATKHPADLYRRHKACDSIGNPARLRPRATTEMCIRESPNSAPPAGFRVPPIRLTPLIRFDNLGNMKSNEAVGALAALAQDSRLALFRLLVKRGPEGYSPGQLVDKLGLPGPTLSFHLKELQRAGLIEARREGRFLFYSPDFSRMNALLGFLTENCCVLADKDCGPSCSPACEPSAATQSQPKRKRA
jgi:ArsR family transcriptional regulator, arsenate/arsenite/antimonite-responsive transcriptional repressor